MKFESVQVKTKKGEMLLVRVGMPETVEELVALKGEKWILSKTLEKCFREEKKTAVRRALATRIVVKLGSLTEEQRELLRAAGVL